MKSKVRRVVYSILILLLVGIVLLVTVGPSRSQYTCLYCRMLKTEKTYWGIPVTKITSNECSIWYNKQQPDHEHSWKWNGSHSRSGMFGFIACGRQHPVWSIPENMQLIFLRQASQEEQKEYFSLLESDEVDYSEEAYKMVNEIIFKTSNYDTSQQ